MSTVLGSEGRHEMKEDKKAEVRRGCRLSAWHGVYGATGVVGGLRFRVKVPKAATSPDSILWLD